jgi:transposase
MSQGGSTTKPLTKSQDGESVMQIKTVGLDIAKNVFQVHGIDSNGKVVVQKPIKRKQVLPYFANLQPCLIGIKACASSHYWQRQLESLGHEVKLINPEYVTPYIKSNKSDARDAEAICEAVTRPSMRFVPKKSLQQQDIQTIHRVRGRLIKQRTALVNQIRGLLGEYGLIMAQGVAALRRQLPLYLEDASNELTPVSREVFADLYEHLLTVDEQIKVYDQKIRILVKNTDACQRLLDVPGIGPIVATALVMALGDAQVFKNGRHMAAYLGLVPRQHSSGGKDRLLGISKRGDRYVRSLLIHGARAMAFRVKNNPAHENQWLYKLIQRRGMNKAVVAFANKIARQAWVILAKAERYLSPCSNR